MVQCAVVGYGPLCDGGVWSSVRWCCKAHFAVFRGITHNETKKNQNFSPTTPGRVDPGTNLTGVFEATPPTLNT